MPDLDGRADRARLLLDPGPEPHRGPKRDSNMSTPGTGSLQEIGGLDPVAATGATVDRMRVLVGAEVGHLLDLRSEDSRSVSLRQVSSTMSCRIFSDITVSLGSQSLTLQGIGEKPVRRRRRRLGPRSGLTKHRRGSTSTTTPNSAPRCSRIRAWWAWSSSGRAARRKLESDRVRLHQQPVLPSSLRCEPSGALAPLGEPRRMSSGHRLLSSFEGSLKRLAPSG